MTKKDYCMMADLIAGHYEYQQIDRNEGGGMSALAMLARDLASRLAWMNPKFDSGRFLRACGIEG